MTEDNDPRLGSSRTGVSRTDTSRLEGDIVRLAASSAASYASYLTKKKYIDYVQSDMNPQIEALKEKAIRSGDFTSLEADSLNVIASARENINVIGGGNQVEQLISESSLAVKASIAAYTINQTKAVQLEGTATSLTFLGQEAIEAPIERLVQNLRAMESLTPELGAVVGGTSEAKKYIAHQKESTILASIQNLARTSPESAKTLLNTVKSHLSVEKFSRIYSVVENADLVQKAKKLKELSIDIRLNKLAATVESKNPLGKDSAGEETAVTKTPQAPSMTREEREEGIDDAYELFQVDPKGFANKFGAGTEMVDLVSSLQVFPKGYLADLTSALWSSEKASDRFQAATAISRLSVASPLLNRQISAEDIAEAYHIGTIKRASTQSANTAMATGVISSNPKEQAAYLASSNEEKRIVLESLADNTLEATLAREGKLRATKALLGLEAPERSWEIVKADYEAHNPQQFHDTVIMSLKELPAYTDPVYWTRFLRVVNLRAEKDESVKRMQDLAANKIGYPAEAIVSWNSMVKENFIHHNIQKRTELLTITGAKFFSEWGATRFGSSKSAGIDTILQRRPPELEYPNMPPSFLLGALNEQLAVKGHPKVGYEEASLVYAGTDRKGSYYYVTLLIGGDYRYPVRNADGSFMEYHPGVETNAGSSVEKNRGPFDFLPSTSKVK